MVPFALIAALIAHRVFALAPDAFGEDVGDRPDEADATVDVQAAPPGSASATVTSVPLGPDVAGVTSLAGVLDRVPGTTVRKMGGLGDFSAVRLRGSTFQQVEIFLDGVPLNPNGDSVVDLASLPVATFSRMLVYRGFAPARYGSAAMGGVVDLLTASGSATASPAALGISAGSWGTLHSWGATRRAVGMTDVLLTFDQLHTDGNWPYFDDQGTEYNRLDDRTPRREHNRIDRASGVARVRTRLGTASFTLLDTPTWTDEELTGTISNPASAAIWAGARNLLVFDADFVGAVAAVRRTSVTGPQVLWRVRPRLWWLHRDETLNDPLAELGVGGAWTRGVWNTGGAQVDTVLAPARWLTASLLVRARDDVYTGFDLTQADENGGATGATDGERSRQALTLALSGDAVLPVGIGSITLSPILQLDVLDNHLLGEVPFGDLAVSPGTEDLDVHLLPRGAASWTPWGPLTFRGSAGLYKRAPDLNELFGDQGLLVGNTDLVAESGFGLEAGARVADTRVGPLTVGTDLAYARQRVHDLITYVPNSQQTEHAVNLDEAYFRSLEGGLSLGLDGHLGGLGLALRSDSAVTQILARNLDSSPTYSNNALPNVAPLDVSQTTSLSMSARWLDRLSLSHSWSYTSATFQDEANQIPTAPRDLHSVAASVRVSRALPTVEASILNLFNVRGMAVDRNPLDPGDDTLVVKPLTDFVGYPLPGRTVMVTARWEGSVIP
ncbi:MAG: hypothetical protein EXR69_03070 [Myxococcales bacterium]|nr:hypothetical protein [Myxococcales bacterium]